MKFNVVKMQCCDVTVGMGKLGITLSFFSPVKFRLMKFIPEEDSYHTALETE